MGFKERMPGTYEFGKFLLSLPGEAIEIYRIFTAPLTLEEQLSREAYQEERERERELGLDAKKDEEEYDYSYIVDLLEFIGDLLDD